MFGNAIFSPLSRWLATLLEEEQYGRQTDLMSEIRADLEFLQERLGAQTRMLIIIDDLDRCEPGKAVEVLQAVNLLLNFPSFVVCLGIDAHVVTAAIEAHYEGLLQAAGASGYEYLDKIIQIPFRIPEPTPGHLEDFLEREVPVAGDEPEAVPEGVAPASTETPQPEREAYQTMAPLAESQERGKERIEEAPFTAEELRAFVEIAPFLRPNPRHIKRLINVYRLVRTLAQLGGAGRVIDQRAAVIRWLAISAQWPYTAYVMMHCFERLAPGGEAVKRGELLPVLYAKTKGVVDPEEQRKLDDDLERLTALLTEMSPEMTRSDFEEIRRYTINFNPAVAERPLGPSDQKRDSVTRRQNARPRGVSRSDQLLELVERFPELSFPRPRSFSKPLILQSLALPRRSNEQAH